MIGIFDSGIGGLTVARAIEKILPHHPLLYLGDTARTPYGTKSDEVIREYALRNAEFLLQKGARVIVIGCNSASSVATQTLRDTFDVPIFEVIGPAARRAASVTSSGRIGIIGTRATIRSSIYERTITSFDPRCRVYSEACPLLVPLVEEGWCNRRETKMIIRKYLLPLKKYQIDVLILGCTHYPLLKDLIQKKVGSRVKLIDSSVEIAKLLQQESEKVCPPRKETLPSHRFYFSDLTDAVHSVASRIFGRDVEILTP